MNILLILCNLLQAALYTCIDEMYDEILQHSSKPNYTIDTAKESIHVVIICKDYIYIKFIELRKEVKTEIILIEEKNKTLINLNNILLDFFGELSQKTLVISTSSDVFKICPKDIEIVFGRNYKQVIVGYSVLNGPKKYRESNCVGLILNQNELSIQYHKYDDNIMNLYILPVSEKSFIHKHVCDFLLCHPLACFINKKFTDRFIQQSSLYNFLFDHLHQFKENQNVNDFISIDKHSITLTINKDPLRAVRIKKSSIEFIEAKNIVVTCKFSECPELWMKIQKFFSSYAGICDDFNHNLTFLYKIIRSNHTACSFLLLGMLSNKNHTHYLLITIISYLLGLADPITAKFFLERYINENDEYSLKLSDTIIVCFLLEYDFKHNSPILLLFKFLMVDAACQCIHDQGDEITRQYKNFKFIQYLNDTIVLNDNDEILFSKHKVYKPLSLIWYLFSDIKPLYELRDTIFYNTLYIINKFILKNDRFYFYSNSLVNYTAEDEKKLAATFAEFN